VPDLLAAARKYIDVPHQWGGGHRNRPYPDKASGLDCSGFVGQAFADIGIRLPGGGIRNGMRFHGLASEHFTGGTPVTRDELQPGDVLFWGKNGQVTQEAIYLGDDKIIWAPSDGGAIRIQEVFWQGFMGARRFL
jgi:cell wall-associated NlpC family hydrolase